VIRSESFGEGNLIDLGKLVSSVTGKASGENSTVTKLLGMVGGQEGLNNLVSQLQSGGLGQKVQSWIGKGSNQPVSGQEIGSALGQDKVEQLSKQTGMSQSQVTDDLAQQLPHVIDHLTPDGHMPGQAN
jgi:uncharacterized protein YidB (DUF937 family)